MNQLLIDTNIYSNAMRGEPVVVSKLKQTSSIGITAVSIGELLSGFKGGGKEDKNRQELNIFLDSPRVVIYSINEDTADFYSMILNALKKKGTPIPTNDIWIAAVALQHGIRLYSLDKHFNYIEGLLLVG